MVRFIAGLIPLVMLLLSLPVPTRSAETAVSPARSAAPKRPKRIYHTTRLVGPPPVIDGRFDDACWRDAGTWTSDYSVLTPAYGAVPTHQTELKILYDERNLYVAMRAHDGPAAGRSHNAGDRDEFSGDIMGVTFDSYHDLRTGFEFDLTSSGQKIDLRLLNTSWDTTWNAVWEGKVAHEEGAWTAEFLIPLNQLRYAAGNTVWGLHSWRWIDRHKEESDWNLLANDDSGFVQSFGELHGLEGLRSARRLEIVPYTSVVHERIAGGPAENKLRAGLDAKIGLTSNFTLDASILPDFGQVEADPSVMNLTAFETFLTERRSLFLEGKDIFEFGFGSSDRVFYSRRIGQPPSLRPAGTIIDSPESTTLLGALKLSGKTAGGLALGVLASASDREEAVIEDGAGRRSVLVGPSTAHLVVRAQQDFRQGDTLVGGIVSRVQRDLTTDALRATLPEEATVAGVDLLHYWADREYFLRAVAVGSNVSGDPRAISRLQLSSARYYQRPINGVSDYDPARDALDGAGLWLQAGKGSKGNWRWREDLTVKTPGLEFNDLGYLATADRIRQAPTVSYIVKQPAKWYRSYEVNFTQSAEWTTQGEWLGAGTELETGVELSNKWNLSAEWEHYGEGRDPVALRGGPLLRVPAGNAWSLSLSTDSTKKVAGKIYWEGNRAGHNASAMTGYGGKLTVRPVPALLLTLAADASQHTDRMRYVAPTPVGEGTAGNFVSRLEGESRSVSLRAQWIIRPELRLQYYGNPFGSTVRYAEFRRVLAPGAAEYAQRFGPVLPAALADGRYYIDANGDGTSDYELGDPDENYGSFHSNLVLKWEYRRGSMVYFVWSQQREGAGAEKSLEAWSALSGLRHQAPNNQFMVKMTYWFSL